MVNFRPCATIVGNFSLSVGYCRFAYTLNAVQPSPTQLGQRAKLSPACEAKPFTTLPTDVHNYFTFPADYSYKLTNNYRAIKKSSGEVSELLPKLSRLSPDFFKEYDSMFMRHRFFRMFFVGFFALMLIGGLRQSSYRNAYYQGFQSGQSSAEQVAPPADGPVNSDGPAAERGPGYTGDGYRDNYNGYYRGHGFSPFRFLFTFIFFMFFFKVMRRMVWGGRGRHHSGHHWKTEWKKQYRDGGSKGFGPFNEFNQRDGRSAKERKHDESNDDGPIYEM
jgi:hypothetical protein